MKVRSAERGAKLLMDFRKKGGKGKEREKEKGAKKGTPSSGKRSGGGGGTADVKKEVVEPTKIIAQTITSPAVPVIRINLFD